MGRRPVLVKEEVDALPSGQMGRRPVLVKEEVDALPSGQMGRRPVSSGINHHVQRDMI